jgi:outer membrane biosynthesis protein TonB
MAVDARCFGEVVYPALARAAGREGTVVVEVKAGRRRLRLVGEGDIWL